MVKESATCDSVCLECDAFTPLVSRAQATAARSWPATPIELARLLSTGPSSSRCLPRTELARDAQLAWISQSFRGMLFTTRSLFAAVGATPSAARYLCAEPTEAMEVLQEV